MAPGVVGFFGTLVVTGDALIFATCYAASLKFFDSHNFGIAGHSFIYMDCFRLVVVAQYRGPVNFVCFVSCPGW